MQVCTLLQTDNHTSTPPLYVFTGRMPFLPPNQQRQSTEGKSTEDQPTYSKEIAEVKDSASANTTFSGRPSCLLSRLWIW